MQKMPRERIKLSTFFFHCILIVEILSRISSSFCYGANDMMTNKNYDNDNDNNAINKNYDDDEIIIISTNTVELTSRERIQQQRKKLSVYEQLQPDQQDGDDEVVRNSDNQNRKGEQQQSRNEEQRELASDATICNSLLKVIYESNYEQTRSPCICSRESDKIIEQTDVYPNGHIDERVIPGTFEINCVYDYCQACDDDNINGVCGQKIANYSYTENNDSPSKSSLNEGLDCIQYTTATDDRTTLVCLRTTLLYDDIFGCQIRIGEGFFIDQCDSCKYVVCDRDISNDVEIAFDCTNLGLYELNPCNYTPYTDVDLPEPTNIDKYGFDPLSSFRPIVNDTNEVNVFRFDACYERPSGDGSASSSNSTEATTTITIIANTPAPGPTASSSSSTTEKPMITDESNPNNEFTTTASPNVGSPTITIAPILDLNNDVATATDQKPVLSTTSTPTNAGTVLSNAPSSSPEAVTIDQTSKAPRLSRLCFSSLFKISDAGCIVRVVFTLTILCLS